ncbi:hypothetical protein A5662_17565 [Mycobacteriaceae bacterium 1482268.1]|nr:hypothetical protein A5662_17565 [Mycobacteriaceae bacterium 1482268.1]
MRKYRFSSKARNPRVLCVSYRDVAPVISRCAQYEFEDLIAELDAVDVVAPEGLVAPEDADTPVQAGILTLNRLAVKALRRLKLRIEAALPFTGRRRVPPGVDHSYEMLLVNCEAPGDLYNLAPFAMWRSVARVSVCYVQELWAADVPHLGGVLDILKRFDHVFVENRETVKPLEAAIGRPCHEVQLSVDALKFCAYPENPARVIDFYAMGHTPPETHKALLRMAEERDWYYMYDTVFNTEVSSHVDHRRRLADMIKRSRFFLVNIASWHKGEAIAGQEVLGLRYFEGAAGGAVLIGDAPDSALFEENFGWQDSVIPLAFDSADIADVIAELESDPSRLERISKTNMVNALRRHDHLYRWDQILSITGLKETTAMECRRQELADRAELIERTLPRLSGVSDRRFAG